MVLDRALQPEGHEEDQELHVLFGQVGGVEKEVEADEMALGVVDVEPEGNRAEVEPIWIINNLLHFGIKMKLFLCFLRTDFKIRTRKKIYNMQAAMATCSLDNSQFHF